MYILVSNVGSTSLKFKLFDMPGERVLCESKIESVGSRTNAAYYYKNALKDIVVSQGKKSVADYAEGIRMFLSSLIDPAIGIADSVDEIAGVGFKTVLAKGYYGVHPLDSAVLRAMEEYLFVAPGHNGPYLQAIEQFRRYLPGAFMAGVFETAFHTTIPKARRMYAIPYEWYERYGVMRMGYHGASHAYIARQCAPVRRVISCHLGGSCSVCAIEDGKSVDNSFGFSLQTGIPHANRAGDVDPYIVPFLMNEGMPMEEILSGLGKRSGLLGLSGVSCDLREIEAAAKEGNERAQLAIDVFVCSIVRYIGAYYAELGGLDRLVFTGGIGENDANIRREVCQAVDHMGIVLDETANLSGCGDRRISAANSPVEVFVLKTNEELGVARETYQAMGGYENSQTTQTAQEVNL